MLTRRFQVFWSILLIAIALAVGLISMDSGKQKDLAEDSGQVIDEEPVGVPKTAAVYPVKPPAEAITAPDESATSPTVGEEPQKHTALPVKAAQGLPNPSWPIKAKVTKPHGWQFSRTMQDWRWHGGIDIQAKEGSEVVAAYEGKLLSYAYDSEWGGQVVIQHRDGWQTFYAGCDQSFRPQPTGSAVIRGQVICRVGAPGLAETADGPHLHFEVRSPEGTRANPEPLLRE